MHDVVVVGAGPVGLYAASQLSGFSVKVLEAAKAVGSKACSGLYSTRIAGFIPIEKSNAIEHKVSGCILHSPSHSITLEKKGEAAYVVDRKAFNQWLLDTSAADVSLGTRVTSISTGNGAEKALPLGKKQTGSLDKSDKSAKEESSGQAIVKAASGEFKSQLILGCDGSASVVRRHFGQEPKEIVTGLIATASERDYSSLVELWFNPEQLPDGFYWRIPRGESVEYGMLGSRASFSILEKKFQLKSYEKRAASIPMGPSKTFFNRALLLGDSAGITKPWSGGGVIYGFTCAQQAKKTIENAFASKDFSEQSLAGYETLWKAKLWKQILAGMLFRKLFKSLTNAQLDSIFSRLDANRLNKTDMDFPALDVLA